MCSSGASMCWEAPRAVHHALIWSQEVYSDPVFVFWRVFIHSAWSAAAQVDSTMKFNITRKYRPGEVVDGGMTGNDWTVQFGCPGKSEWKNLTSAAHFAANPESHKYERVPWEVGHVKTKVPGSGSGEMSREERRQIELWKFNLGERSAPSQSQRTLTEDDMSPCCFMPTHTHI